MGLFAAALEVAFSPLFAPNDTLTRLRGGITIMLIGDCAPLVPWSTKIPCC